MQFLSIQLHRFPLEQILQAHRSDLSKRGWVAQELFHVRQELDRDFTSLRGSENALFHHGRGGGQRHDNLMHNQATREGGNISDRTYHGHAVDSYSLLQRIIIDKPDRSIKRLLIALHVPDEEFTRLP